MATLRCDKCGKPLNAEDKFCSGCGAPISESIDSPTVPGASEQKGPTNYDTPPYGAPGQNPYLPPDPYGDPLLPPPPPPPARSTTPPSSPDKSRPPIMGILIVVIVLLVLSSATGAFVLTQRRGVTQVNSTATTQAQLKTTIQANNTLTAQVQANVPLTASATVLQNIYIQATNGTPVLSDPLSHQDSYNWDESANCTFVGGTYHASWLQANNFITCSPKAQLNNFGDFAFQVQMTIIHGDYEGMYFRANSTGTDYYTFTIHQSGQYSLDVYKSNNYLKSVSNGSSSVFKSGLNQSNLITVVARGGNFYLYINGQFVARGSDTSNSAGSIGLLAGDDTHPTEVAFSDLKVWSI